MKLPARAKNKKGSIFAPIKAIIAWLFLNRDLPEHLPPLWKRVAIFVLAAPFFGYYIYSFIFQKGEEQLNYPFSSMAFYSENRDAKPYSEPKYYPIYRGYYEIGQSMDGDTPPYDFDYIASDVAEPLRLLVATKEVMESTHNRIRDRYGALTSWSLLDGTLMVVSESKDEIGYIRTYSQLAAVPPSTEPAFPLAVMHGGLLAVEDDLGFRGVGAILAWDEEREQYRIDLDPWGWENPEFSVFAHRDLRVKRQMSSLLPLEGEWEGNRFYIKSLRGIDGSNLHTLIYVSDPELGVEEEIYSGPENFQGYR